MPDKENGHIDATAMELFLKLNEREQTAIIELLKSLLSEQ
jgi:hypothetical protein